MTIQTKKFEASEYLDSPEAISAYLNAALEENDSAFLMSALANVIKAVGVAKVASDAGIGRESLYKTIAPGAAPRFDTVMKLANALGVELAAKPMQKAAEEV
jgi:probable addiction module antidote protein